MKANKFWITATAAVATAGTIGLAIAQNAQTSGAGQSLATPGTGTNVQGNASRNSGSTTNNLGTTNSTGSMGSTNSTDSTGSSTGATGAVSGSSDAASSTTVAKADRG